MFIYIYLYTFYIYTHTHTYAFFPGLFTMLCLHSYLLTKIETNPVVLSSLSKLVETFWIPKELRTSLHAHPVFVM